MTWRIILEAVETAWQIAPLPATTAVLLIAAYAWLYLEFRITTVTRQIRGWQRPVPGMPLLSEAGAWATRVLKWVIGLWACVFLLLFIGACVGAARSEVSPITRTATHVGRYWLAARQVLDRPLLKALKWGPAPDDAGTESWLLEPLESQPTKTTATPFAKPTLPARSPSRDSDKAGAPIPCPTPTRPPDVIVAVQNASLREGPGTKYHIVGYARLGDCFGLLGQNPTGTWYRICCPFGVRAWIARSLVQETGEVDKLPVIKDIPSTPVPPTP